MCQASRLCADLIPRFTKEVIKTFCKKSLIRDWDATFPEWGLGVPKRKKLPNVYSKAVALRVTLLSRDWVSRKPLEVDSTRQHPMWCGGRDPLMSAAPIAFTLPRIVNFHILLMFT